MIPFVRDMAFEYGRVDQVSPGIQRVVARNPSAFTHFGTGTYIVGDETVAVIDPGPLLEEHLRALRTALEGRRVSHILITHTHIDHSPLVGPLQAAVGGTVVGLPAPASSDGMEGSQDGGFVPDQVVRDGQAIGGPGWTLRALMSPGHASNHVCYALEEENALFSGDHVMGWATTVIVPPDGDMSDYYASLRAVMARGFDTLWPTHGPPVREVAPFLDAYLSHRQDREAQLLRALQAGPATIGDMAPRLYRGVDPRLLGAARQSMLAGLIHLVREGSVATDGAADMTAVYHLT